MTITQIQAEQAGRLDRAAAYRRLYSRSVREVAAEVTPNVHGVQPHMTPSYSRKQLDYIYSEASRRAVMLVDELLKTSEVASA